MSTETTIAMPQLGETVTEGTITRWLKRVGESIAKYEPFAEVATDKVNAEIPAPVAGILMSILVGEGETVPTGAPIAIIGNAVVDPSANRDSVNPNGTSPAAGIAAEVDPSTVLAGTEGVPNSSQRSISLDEAAVAPARGVAVDFDPDARYSPAVRRAMREHNIAQLPNVGTGAHGRITLDDVMAFVASRGNGALLTATLSPAGTIEPAPRAIGSARSQRVPLTRIRRIIADRMTEAKRTIPHAWTMVEVDVTKLVERRRTERHAFSEKHGVSLTYFPFFAHAVIQAALSHPMMNARFLGNEIEVFQDVDLSFAIALENNLVVPVVRRAQELTFIELAQSIADLTSRARSGKLSVDSLSGGTLTVNNTGANGSVLSAPVIHGGQAAIVTLEAIVKRPVVVTGDAIAIRSMVNICCSIDHRVIDGDVVGGFLRSVKSSLEAAGTESLL